MNLKEIDNDAPLGVLPEDRAPHDPAALAALCDCGHVRDAHEHYRAGTDCAVCGRSGCRKFRPSALTTNVHRVGDTPCGVPYSVFC